MIANRANILIRIGATMIAAAMLAACAAAPARSPSASTTRSSRRPSTPRARRVAADLLAAAAS